MQLAIDTTKKRIFLGNFKRLNDFLSVIFLKRNQAFMIFNDFSQNVVVLVLEFDIQ